MCELCEGIGTRYVEVRLLALMSQNPNFPPSLVVQHGPIRIGVIHGHQAVPLGDAESLAAIARKMDVDVLVSGATHRCVDHSSDTDSARRAVARAV